MHWADRIAKALLRRSKRHVIASGISISGHIHIGHSNDVFIADAIRRSIEELGGKARVLWYADDFDPMRRVPWPLPKEYEKYLGVPYAEIPSPDPEYENFVDFFSRPFIEALDDFGVQVDVCFSSEIYRSGKLANLTRVALERADEIKEILNRYRSEPLRDDWLPYDAICERCNRLATTRSYDWDGNFVKYRCEGAPYVKGCGYEGEADYTKGEGKLTWRVEWPARWKLLGVTCEPFGKDHATAGGSYDTGKVISRQIFDYPPPYPVPYEWVSFRGKPMSSSKGTVFTLQQWLEVAEPELLRYFIFRSKAMKAKDFDPGSQLLDLYDEYDNLEAIYFGAVEVSDNRKSQLQRIYEISQVRKVPERKPQKVPFRLAAVLSQVARCEEHAVEILKSKGILIDPSEEELRCTIERLRRARCWVEKYAPERFKLKLIGKLPDGIRRELTEKQKLGLRRLASDLSTREFSPVDLHNHVYEVARELKTGPAKLFEAIYMVLLGRKSGPRIGNFISALDKGFVIKRFEEASI
ncbi:MAG: lysine--tRNA ligase [Hadesarchaea archaeon]|nr:lysine--tRNA ligase [Hadesarchaea archaeon]